MNEVKITQFLAIKILRWELHEGINQGGGIENYWMEPKNIEDDLQFSPQGIGESRERDFDPLHNIAHAFMVVEKIKGDWFEIGWITGDYHACFEKPNAKVADQSYYEHFSKNLCEAISIAVVGALATPEQLEEMEIKSP